MIGLSACTHCGACSLECSSNMFFESFQNDFILPSEKVQFLKNLAAGRELDPDTLKRLQQGLYICTSCDRCTDICPSGINLKELFVSSRYALLARGIPETSMLSHFSFPLALAQYRVDDHLQGPEDPGTAVQKELQGPDGHGAAPHPGSGPENFPTPHTGAAIPASAAPTSVRSSAASTTRVRPWAFCPIRSSTASGSAMSIWPWARR